MSRTLSSSNVCSSDPSAAVPCSSQTHPTSTSPSTQRRQQILSYEQVMRLNEVMCSEVLVHSRLVDAHHPPLRLKLRTFIREVRRHLLAEGVEVKDVRLSGGTASYVISEDSSCTYNDFDFLFHVQLPSQENGRSISKVKPATLSALSSFLPEQQRRHQHPPTRDNLTEFLETYIQKLFRVVGEDSRSDCWSLISLGHIVSQENECLFQQSQENSGPEAVVVNKSIDLKFVHQMKRAYEFTVDSFQILLDSLLVFYEVSGGLPLSLQLFPTVMAESVAGDFHEARLHLEHRLISTIHPEEIHGGGLLKYCRLLVEGYHAVPEVDIAHLEKYMCSRFFIDHMDTPSQHSRIISYMNSHFPTRSGIRVRYLQVLQNVIWHSTVCLMNQERTAVMQLIEVLIAEAAWHLQQTTVSPPMPQYYIVPPLISAVNQNDIGGSEWVCDGVYYGASFFPPLDMVPPHVVYPAAYPSELSPSSSTHSSNAPSSGFSSMSQVEGTHSSFLSCASSLCASPSLEQQQLNDPLLLHQQSLKAPEPPDELVQLNQQALV